MRIAIDLDGVVFQFIDTYLQFINETHKLNISREQAKGIHFIRNFGFTEEQDKQLMREFCYHGKFRDLPLIPDALYNIRKLIYESKHDVIYITSRDPEAVEDTFVALFNLGLNGEVHFSDKINRKAHLIETLECDVMIEDRWDYLKEVKERNPDVIAILFNYEDQLEPLDDWKPDHYVTNWSEIYSILQTV